MFLYMPYQSSHQERQGSYFFKATLPLKPATIALKIVHQRLSRHFLPMDQVMFFCFFKRKKAIHLRQERGLSDAENSG